MITKSVLHLIIEVKSLALALTFRVKSLLTTLIKTENTPGCDETSRRDNCVMSQDE